MLSLCWLVLLLSLGLHTSTQTIENLISRSRLLPEVASDRPPQYVFEKLVISEMTWKTASFTPNLKQFGFFYNSEGEGFIRFGLRVPKRNELLHVRYVVVWLKDPYYNNGRIATVLLEIEQDLDPVTNTWHGTAKCSYKLEYNNKLVRESSEPQDCTYIITIEWSLQVAYKDFVFETTVHDPLHHKYLPWTMMLPNLIVCISLLLVRRRVTQAHKLSMVTLGLALNTIVFVSISQMNFGAEGFDSPEIWFLLTGFTTFLCSVHFTFTFVSIVSRMNAAQYCGFYLITFAYIWLVVNFSNRAWFLLMNSLTLLPQLIHNELYVMGAIFDPCYLVCVFTYQYFALYMHGYPYNRSYQYPRPWLCLAIIAIVAAQVFVNYLQSRSSKRYLIPSYFLEGRFNFVEVHHIKPATNNSLLVPLESYQIELGYCAICLTMLASRPYDRSRETTDTEAYSCMPHTIHVIRTPCNHRYHMDCLKNWMDHKLECPVDRTPLSPIIVE